MGEEHRHRRIQVRLFKSSDVEGVYEIEKASFPNPWNRALFLQIYYRSPEGFLVAEDDGEIVGYGIFTHKHKPFLHGHLLNLAVKEGHRGRGVGRILLKTILSKLEDKGAVEVSLEVQKSNIAARRFYSSFGFKEDREIKNYYGSGENAIIMHLKLKR